MYMNIDIGTPTLNQANLMETTDELKAIQKVSYPRRLMGIGCTGQTAGDATFELKVGKMLLASFRTQQASNHLQRDELIPLNGAYFLQESLGTMSLGDTNGMTLTPNLKDIEEWSRDRHILKIGLVGGSAESDSAINMKSGRIGS